MRTFDELFPGLSYLQKMQVFDSEGLRNISSVNEPPRFSPAPNSGIDLYSIAMQNSPTQFVEVVAVVPYGRRRLNRLDIYNVMGRIKAISNYQSYSTARESYVTVFEESSRLADAGRNRLIPDPPPATVLPSSETVFVYLKDMLFGNTYFRGELSISYHGLFFNLTNTATVRFLFVPVVRAEKFITILYAEPLEEGMLIYGLAGLDVPQFLAQRVNLELHINMRITIFMNWLIDGFRSIS